MSEQRETATLFTEVGVDYCLTHAGLRNEDEQWCDNFGKDDCPACEGSGYAEDDSDCPACKNHGVTLCDRVPLGYLASKNGSDPKDAA